MAHEGLRSHLSGSVPVSIVVHLVILLVLVVIPLSDIGLPTPMTALEPFVLAAALPVPPAPPPPTPVASTTPSPSGPSAPIKAPEKIEPETIAAPPSIAAPDTGAGGVPGGGIGDGVAILAPPTPPPPAPEPPKAQGPVRVAQLPEAPHKIADVRPIYPEVARAAHVEGTVILEAVLDTTGHVTQVRVIRSVPLLDQAALDAVRQWRYAPSMYGGRAVSVLMTITVRFTLQ